MEELIFVTYPPKYQGMCPKCQGDSPACSCKFRRTLLSSDSYSVVQFSDPLVTGGWCYECHPCAPPRYDWPCSHFQHIACISNRERVYFEIVASREYDHTLAVQDDRRYKVKKLHEDSKLSQQANDDSAAYDLYSPVSLSIAPHSGVKVPLHIAMHIPQGQYGPLASCSSFAERRVPVTGCVIDRGYRGDGIVLLENKCKQPFQVTKGDRIAPSILQRHSTSEVEEATELSVTARETGGFGSTRPIFFSPPQNSPHLDTHSVCPTHTKHISISTHLVSWYVGCRNAVAVNG